MDEPQSLGHPRRIGKLDSGVWVFGVCLSGSDEVWWVDDAGGDVWIGCCFWWVHFCLFL